MDNLTPQKNQPSGVIRISTHHTEIQHISAVTVAAIITNASQYSRTGSAAEPTQLEHLLPGEHTVYDNNRIIRNQ